jgi:lipopolysaccharide/colanic/teichoic acid biosynthesis glycosyltransferase
MVMLVLIIHINWLMILASPGLVDLLVGPRPPLPYEVEAYSLHDLLRLCGKPGLTGTWQVYARSRAAFQEMVEMDIAYLQQQSIWQDLKLIALTIPIMLQGRGGV